MRKMLETALMTLGLEEFAKVSLILSWRTSYLSNQMGIKIDYKVLNGIRTPLIQRQGRRLLRLIEVYIAFESLRHLLEQS